MPISGGKYRVHTTKTGKKVRLHFTDHGEVDEAKNMETGEMHTPGEFREEEAKEKALERLAAGQGRGMGTGR